MTKKMPIIITGIHRSGTTLVSKIIEDNNVFLGKYKDINNESVFFQNINKWLMSINSSSWDNPSSFLESINTENFKLNLDKLKLILHSKMNVQYFGMNNIIFNKKFDNIKNQWGWKDPRNIFTLPFWLKLFPKSKVIIIIRHPIDVVNSLLDREKNNIIKDKKNFKKYYPYFLVALFRLNNFSNRSSMAINDFNEGINLYIKYINEIKKIKSEYKNNIKIVKYEDIIQNKLNSINDILAFCEIEQINQKNKLLETISDDRMYNFKLENKSYMKYEKIIKKCGYKINS